MNPFRRSTRDDDAATEWTDWLRTDDIDGATYNADGWRTDALGRLACPDCQQARADYRTPQPVTWHHPTVARHWHERGTVLREEEAFRLGVEAELGKRISYEDPALAGAIAGATYRH